MKNILTMADINRDFTATVKQYLDKGYTFRISGMGGSQGEVAKVDLTNGAEVIRVLLDRECERSIDSLSLIVGRVTDNISERHTLIWNSHLEVISKRRFFVVDRDNGCFTLSYDEICKIREKRLVRYDNDRYKEYPFPDQTRAKAIVLPFVRRHKGLARASIKQIDSVYYAVCGGDKSYYVRVKGRILELSARR